MKIQVTNDDGSSAFEYDTAKNSNCLCPGQAEKPAVVAALTEATSFLGSNTHVIASIKADIQTAVDRIETELGAHPAFTWAQTKLGNAITHLEAYVKGEWTEPPIVTGVGVDLRGVITSIGPNATVVPPPAPTPALGSTLPGTSES